MDIRFSVIIPTVGRPSLTDVLKDLLTELPEEDEILVVGDGPQPAARALAEGLGGRVRYLEHGPTKDWGHSQRNAAMRVALGTHIMTMDDDDRVVVGAGRAIRSRVAEAPDRVHFFRMYHQQGVIWNFRQVRECNVSTQMVVVPNVPGRLGVWGNRYEGDYDFITSTVALYPGGEADAVWHEEITVVHGIRGGLSDHPPDVIRRH